MYRGLDDCQFYNNVYFPHASVHSSSVVQVQLSRRRALYVIYSQSLIPTFWTISSYTLSFYSELTQRRVSLSVSASKRFCSQIRAVAVTDRVYETGPVAHIAVIFQSGVKYILRGSDLLAFIPSSCLVSHHAPRNTSYRRVHLSLIMGNGSLPIRRERCSVCS